MKYFLPILAVSLAVCVAAPVVVEAANDYEQGPDSKPQEGVPEGDLIKFPFEASKIFPGTTRECTIYAACGDKIYRRKVQAQGAMAYDAPIKPPAPHL